MGALVHLHTFFPTSDVNDLGKKVAQFKMLPMSGLQDQSQFSQDLAYDSGLIHESPITMTGS